MVDSCWCGDESPVGCFMSSSIIKAKPARCCLLWICKRVRAHVQRQKIPADFGASQREAKLKQATKANNEANQPSHL
jgi:hypothetical protein